MENIVSHHTDHHEEHEAHESIKIDGFWLFLVSDVLLFGALFATFIVLRTHYAEGPTSQDLFDVKEFTIETFVLLTSSFTSGLATLEMNKGHVKSLITWLIVTALLGATFVGFEIHEFSGMVSEGYKMSTSAFLSGFFTLVGTHGCHVSLGLIWMIGLIIQVARRGFTPVTERKLSIISLYWHFLDAVWIFIFTVVYLIGVM
ncbi:cytochrome aa3 quinol oxidase subunit III [Pullulanibacillus camelliae]|uniref:Cytochrome bo(3) ubiquinol oxidase subunit 3 n=1 Tax=Pullulanibacillus camelliae TaxID=1707096 RepID=A0A8J2YLC1_9BACL|nr:cytochrome o ubiquinol oxidase subunit III [Pullulanibacillus camelliae]GGE50520.1 cytochrome aa3 quinol oxidase subunit III [Pullulanibacillus camelliae]